MLNFLVVEVHVDFMLVVLIKLPLVQRHLMVSNIMLQYGIFLWY